MAVTIRNASVTDIDAINSLGHSDSMFHVSERIHFYEYEELKEWIQNPRENILCVADLDGEMVGFFFCKIMSWHWAMLDNFYSVPTARDGRIGSLMFDSLISQLKERKIHYLTTLVEDGRIALSRYLRQKGFRASKKYEWHELFIDQAHSDPSS